jgi:hypothetical protein
LFWLLWLKRREKETSSYIHSISPSNFWIRRVSWLSAFSFSNRIDSALKQRRWIEVQRKDSHWRRRRPKYIFRDGRFKGKHKSLGLVSYPAILSLFPNKGSWALFPEKCVLCKNPFTRRI